MDKIFVNHYLKEIEIGAFQSERGCTQRVEFNVCLEIKPPTRELNDNVDRALSYEIIIDAIDCELATQRFNLLETLAEKVATRCLLEPRVIRAEVQIEKLDRVTGSLGIRISRKRDNFASFQKPKNTTYNEEHFSLVSFASLQRDIDIYKLWFANLIESDRSFIVIIEPEEGLFNGPIEVSVKNQIRFLSMDQNALLLSSLDQRLAIANTKAELFLALKSRKVVLFCPSQFVKQTCSQAPVLNYGSIEFSEWFAKEMSIKKIYRIGSKPANVQTCNGDLEVTHLKNDDWNAF